MLIGESRKKQRPLLVPSAACNGSIMYMRRIARPNRELRSTASGMSDANKEMRDRAGSDVVDAYHSMSSKRQERASDVTERHVIRSVLSNVSHQNTGASKPTVAKKNQNQYERTGIGRPVSKSYVILKFFSIDSP